MFAVSPMLALYLNSDRIKGGHYVWLNVYNVDPTLPQLLYCHLLCWPNAETTITQIHYFVGRSLPQHVWPTKGHSAVRHCTNKRCLANIGPTKCVTLGLCCRNIGMLSVQSQIHTVIYIVCIFSAILATLKHAWTRKF